MDARNHELNAARADFYQCLAVALMAPVGESSARAMLGGDLSADLAELDSEIGYGLAKPIEQLQAELDAIGDPQALLVLYSQLFLSPPRKVQLNAASYLDGSFNGGTVNALEQCYAENGIMRAESFHDLADHVSVQLEFIAHLYRKSAAGTAPTALSAERFIARYPERWIVPLLADIVEVSERESLANNPYRQLMRILEAAVLHDAESPDGGPLTATERRERALASARQRRAERAVSADEMQEIRKRLEEKGLSTAHLDPENKEDPFAGWQAMQPPTLKR